MAVQMDDYAMRVTDSTAPSLKPEGADVSDDLRLTDKRQYKNGEPSLASSSLSSPSPSSTLVTTIPMFFAPTKQQMHTMQSKTIVDSPPDKKIDQSVVMPPGSHANGMIDSLTPPDEDRSQQPQRLVVRLDLRKIHASKRVDSKVEKRDSHSRPASSTRLLRQRPDHLQPQDYHTGVTPMATATKGSLSVGSALTDSGGTGSSSADSVVAEGGSSATLTPAPSSSSTSITTSSPSISHSTPRTTPLSSGVPRENQSGVYHNGDTVDSTNAATLAVRPIVERTVRKRTRSSSEGPDKRIAIATTEGSPTLGEDPRTKRRGRPPLSDRPVSQGQPQQSQSVSSSAPAQASSLLRGRPSQKLSVLAKLAQKRDPPVPSLSKQDISVTGDDSAIKHNNDYCESCNGLGQFICCDSCPKAFHFSCCQPPMDPNDLPDEFFCVECKHPPSPNQPGLFKQLLDNMDRMNPKAFALPLDIRTYFRGVVTNSDGEYSDAMDYKPTPKRHNTNTGTNLSLEDDPLHLRDANGQFKACFRCNKTSLGRQIIRCEHCPLYWHLDCLSPPLAHPPPSTRKWMCPNHADHVTPRRRKKRNPIPVRLSKPLARNDGDIEVLSDGSDFDERRILLDDGREVSTTDIIYRVPEHSIKLGFVRKCRQLRQQEPQQTQHQSQQRRLQQQERRRSTSDASVSGHDEEVVNGDQESSTAQTDGEGDDETARFRRLVEVATLEARRPGASELLSALAPPLSSHSPLPSEISHAMLIQDVLLKKLESKQEQDEYLQFRAFQRMVREQGAESVVRRMVEEHETRKAEIAMESLLEMKGSSPC